MRSWSKAIQRNSGATRAGWNSYGAALYCPACSATWDERNKGRPMAGAENTIDVIDGMYARQKGHGIDRSEEFTFMAQFAARSFLEKELDRNQLRAMWTAYCFHHVLEVDNAEYDNDLMELWSDVVEANEETDDWSDYGDFDSFMCSDLV